MRRKIKLSDEELLELLSVPCNTFSSIAVAAGVTRERIRQIYNKKFKHRLGTRKTGRDRVHVCTRLHIAADSRLRPEDPCTAAVWDRAKESGLDVQQVKYQWSSKSSPHRFYKRMLRINGHIVVVAVSADKAWYPRAEYYSAGYYKISTKRLHNMRGAKFVAGLMPTGSIYVFPAGVVGSRSVYIRTTPRGEGMRGRPKINHEDYREAWHLLR